MLFLAAALLWTPDDRAQDLPHLQLQGDTTRFIVDGKPFLILGGELHNSAAGTAEQADSILPKLARAHVNTVLTPVSWELIEPEEGRIDFSIIDHWIAEARAAHPPDPALVWHMEERAYALCSRMDQDEPKEVSARHDARWRRSRCSFLAFGSEPECR